MMICSGCGAQLPDGAQFCTNCGTATGQQGTAAQATGQPAYTGAPYVQQATGAKKKPPVKLIAILAAVAVVVIGLIVFFLVRKPTIRLEKYVTIEYEGYDGFGTANASIDYDAFVKDNTGKVKMTDDAKREIREEGGRVTDKLAAEAFAEFVLSGTLDTRSGLSNGDEITFTWDLDEEYLDYFNVKVRADDITIKVEGLEEIETVDVFDGVELSFEGYAPNGKAVITKKPDNDYASNLSYKIEDGEGLDNGDTVLVRVSSSYGGDVNEYLPERYGVAAKETEKEFTVSGLKEATVINPFDYVDVIVKGTSPAMRIELESKEVSKDAGKLRYEVSKTSGLAIGDTITIKVTSNENDLINKGIRLSATEQNYRIEGGDSYITDVADISDEFLEELQAQAEDVLTQWDMTLKDYKVTMSEPEYVGMILRVSKDSPSDNYLYLIYKADFTDTRAATHALYFDKLEGGYMPIRFRTVVNHDDGSASYESFEKDIINFMEFDYRIGTNYPLRGYENADAMFEDIVKKNTAKYSFSFTKELEDMYKK